MESVVELPAFVHGWAIEWPLSSSRADTAIRFPRTRPRGLSFFPPKVFFFHAAPEPQYWCSLGMVRGRGV